MDVSVCIVASANPVSLSHPTPHDLTNIEHSRSVSYGATCFPSPFLPSFPPSYPLLLYLFFISLPPRPIVPMEYMGEQYFTTKNTVIKYERYLLKELGFCVHVQHPHKVGGVCSWLVVQVVCVCVCVCVLISLPLFTFPCSSSFPTSSF